jgi:hypothetical protein
MKKKLPKAQVGKPVKKSTTSSKPTSKPNYKSLTEKELGRKPTASDSTEYRKGWERGAVDIELNSPTPTKIQMLGVLDNWKFRNAPKVHKKGGSVKSKKK